MAKEAQKLVANNKKVFHDYFVEEKYETGLVLHGTEVKSLRMGKCSIKEAFVSIDKGEAYVNGMHISPYEKGNIFNKDPLRTRKLLMHKAEITKLAGKVAERGYTLMPLQVYSKTEGQRWKSASAAVKSCMTSARISRRRICAGKWNGISR